MAKHMSGECPYCGQHYLKDQSEKAQLVCRFESDAELQEFVKAVKSLVLMGPVLIKPEIETL